MISIISPVQSIARRLLNLFATEEFIRSTYMATVNSARKLNPIKLADSSRVPVRVTQRKTFHVEIQAVADDMQVRVIQAGYNAAAGEIYFGRVGTGI